LEAGTSTESYLAIMAFLILVSISAIGSVTVTLSSHHFPVVTSLIFSLRESVRLELAYGSRYGISRWHEYSLGADRTENSDCVVAPDISAGAVTLSPLISSPF
jgi:hypothetical protein